MWDKSLSTRAKYIQKLMQRGRNGNSNEGSNITCICMNMWNMQTSSCQSIRTTPRAEDARAFTKQKTSTAARGCAKI
jgi:hypothetical protein